jgi:predicted metal-dependent enzyme (double-stranded beta helix superfamily)
MVDTDELIAGCVDAIATSDPHLAVREVLQRASADRQLAETLKGQPPGLNVLYNAPDLTVLNVVWPPLISLFPHDHRMWAAIGIYGGREDNAFYRRQGEQIVASGGKQLEERDVLLLGDDTIHAVHNPARAYTGAIHVYGGDFLGAERSQWDAETLREEPWDLEAVRRQFAEAEERFAGS